MGNFKIIEGIRNMNLVDQIRPLNVWLSRNVGVSKPTQT